MLYITQGEWSHNTASLPAKTDILRSFSTVCLAATILVMKAY